MSENKRKELGELGEFGLIDHLTKTFSSKSKNTVKGIGDDAAVIDRKDCLEVVSTDLLLEGVHFDLRYVPLKHLGYKAVAVNVSDVAAMNAVPKQITVSIGVSNRFSVEALEELYSGIQAACENYDVDLVGGDTSSSASGLVISVTAIGEVDKTDIAFRKGAKVGDVLCVSGDLGAAYMGLQVLEREKQEFLANPNMTPQLDKYEYIVQRQLKPEARVDIVHELKEVGVVPTSMIDISDGLSSEILHICKASNVGMQLLSDSIPMDDQTKQTAMEFNINPSVCAYNGGEDYELLFTIDKQDVAKVEKIFELTTIGQVVEEKEGAFVQTKVGQRIPVTAQGWTHA